MEDTISEISKDLFIKNNKINELNEKLIKGIEFEKIQINDLFYGYDKKRILLVYMVSRVLVNQLFLIFYQDCFIMKKKMI